MMQAKNIARQNSTTQQDSSTSHLVRQTTTQNLYKVDYQLWLEQTLQQLKNRDFKNLDLEHLLEEIEDLSRRSKRKMRNLLTKLWEHLLKLHYWQAALALNKGHWLAEIRSFRQQLQGELEDSPSLRGYLEAIIEDCYRKGRLLAGDRSQLPLETFPKNLQVPIDRLLDENWFLDSQEDV